MRHEITGHPYRPDGTTDPQDACADRSNYGFMCEKPRADHLEEVVKVADTDARRDLARLTEVAPHTVPADPTEPPEPVFTIESCRTCGAGVIWARNLTTGRPAPINAAPVGGPGGGNVLLSKRQGIPSYEVLSANDVAARSTTVQARLRTSHFATCKDAGTWRRS